MNVFTALCRLLVLLTTVLGLAVGTLSPVSAATAVAAPGGGVAALETGTPTATISGLVTDPTGRPLDDIVVEALDANDPAADPVASDVTYQYVGSEHGAFVLHVPAGDYKVRFSSFEYATASYETLYYGGGAGTTVTVSDGEALDLDPVQLRRDVGVPVTGTVLDENGDPLVGVEVALYRRDTGGYLYDIDWTRTNSRGRYTFDRVNTNRAHTVHARGDSTFDGTELDYTSLYLGNQLLPSKAQMFTPPPESTDYTVGAITLTPAATVTGTVTDAAGDPVESVDISVLAYDDTTGSFEYVSQWDWSDSDGRYRVRGLAQGQEYTVLADGSWVGYQEVYYGGATEEAGATRFSVPAGSTSMALDAIVLTRPATKASGTVTDLAGQPLEGVNVELMERYDGGDWAYWDYVQSTETDADGTYRFSRLRPGAVYTVMAEGWSAGFGTRWYGDVETETEARTFSLPEDGSPVTLDPVTLPREAGTLTGRVLLGDGATVDGYVHVELRRWDDTAGTFEFVESFSSETGRYRFRDVTPGVYTVRASYWPDGRPSSMYAEGWLGNAGEPTDASGDGVLTVTEDLQSTSAADITLARASTVFTGRISAADGGVLYGESSVDLYRWNDLNGSFDWVDSTYTWDGGEYWFTDLPAGTYAVSAGYYPYEGPRYVTTWHGATGERPEGPDAPGAVTVTGPEDTTGIDIALRRGQRVSGTVRDDSGNPLKDAWVAAYEWVDYGDWWQLDYVDSAPSDRRGRYSLAVRPNSNLWIRADREGFSSYLLGGVDGPGTPTGDNTLAVGTADVTHDIAMAANWGDIGAGAVEPLGQCLDNNSWGGDWIPFGPGLYLTGTGVLSEQYLRGHRPEQLEATGRVALLAPFMARRGRYDVGTTTWGISPDGTRLCVLWKDVRVTRGDGTNTYQAIVEESPAGGYDVRFNYDRVSWTRDAVVGWTDGTGAAGTHHVVPGSEDGGYLDSASTGLVNNGTGATPGRYEFHLADLHGRNPEPWNDTRPFVDGSPVVGQTLTATPGSWFVDGERRPDLDFVYTWKSNASGVARNVGTGDTYTVTEADRNGRLWVSVQASEGAPKAGFAISNKVTVGLPAATNTSLPQVSPSAPRVGDTLTADAGTWEVADGGTMDDLVASYQWLRDGAVVWGETEPTYVVRDEDELASLRVRVTMRRDGYAQVRATSDPVEVAASPRLVATTDPTLSGNSSVGETLTVDPGVWDTDGGGVPEFGYEWVVGYRTVEPDAGSGGTAYTLTTDDVGEYVTVYVRATMPGFKSGTAHAVSPLVSGAGVDYGALAGTVTRSADGTPVSGAWWSACESQTWNCASGRTAGDGSFGSSSVLGSAAGVDYTVTVYAPDGSDLVDGSATATVVTGQTANVTVSLDAVTPPPPNVSVPTSTGTYQGVPTVYWGEPQEIVVEGCDVENPTYTVTFSDGTPSRSGPMTKGADLGGGRFSYSATIPAFYPSHGQTTIGTNIPAQCGDPEPTSFTIYIDPSGVVTDQYGRPIDGATVTLLRADTPAGPFTVVPDGSEVMSPENRDNPDTTDATGFFRWDVSEGYYKVRVDAAGCSQLVTSTMPVPPPAIDLLLKLDCDVTAPALDQPTVSGTGTVGSTLIATLGAVAEPLVGNVQWLRDGEPIPGATEASYTLTADDAGRVVSVRHTAQRPTYVQEEGRGVPVTFTAVEAVSSAVTVVKEKITATQAPTLSGTPKVGQTLTAGDGAWSHPGVTLAYQWKRNGAAIIGATAKTYTAVAADVGTKVSVEVTAGKPGFDDGRATSAAVDVAKGDAPVATTAPTVTGTRKVGQVLTASSGTWSPATGLSYGYQWLRDGAVIQGATARTYTVVAADAGRKLSVRVTARRAGYLDGTATSVAATVSKLASRTATSLPKKVVAVGRIAKVVVTVRATGAVPTGKVTVFRGRKAVKTVTLAAKNRGRVVVAVGRMRAGKYAFTSLYRGNAQIAPSRSKRVTLTVR